MNTLMPRFLQLIQPAFTSSHPAAVFFQFVVASSLVMLLFLLMIVAPWTLHIMRRLQQPHTANKNEVAEERTLATPVEVSAPKPTLAEVVQDFHEEEYFDKLPSDLEVEFAADEFVTFARSIASTERTIASGREHLQRLSRRYANLQVLLDFLREEEISVPTRITESWEAIGFPQQISQDSLAELLDLDGKLEAVRNLKKRVKMKTFTVGEVKEVEGLRQWASRTFSSDRHNINGLLSMLRATKSSPIQAAMKPCLIGAYSDKNRFTKYAWKRQIYWNEMSELESYEGVPRFVDLFADPPRVVLISAQYKGDVSSWDQEINYRARMMHSTLRNYLTSHSSSWSQYEQQYFRLTKADRRARSEIYAAFVAWVHHDAHTESQRPYGPQKPYRPGSPLPSEVAKAILAMTGSSLGFYLTPETARQRLRDGEYSRWARHK